MFQSIKIMNGIKHHDVTYKFKEGITAVTGPNGCGKSLLIEYLIFSLFGVVALRLPSEKYKGLSVETLVTIKDKEYLIERSLTNCKLYHQGQVICQGTKACNNKLIELLGYNYQVFKMANYSAQFEITELGKMKPSERKAAVDKVLGLGIIDTLIKYTNETSNKYASEARGIEKGLILPVEPTDPKIPFNEEQINQSLSSLKTIIDRKILLKNLKEALPTIKTPSKPEKPENYQNSLEVQKLLMRKNILEKDINYLESLPNVEYSLDQLNEYKQQWEFRKVYEDYLYKKSMIPSVKPEISLTEALNGLAAWNDYAIYLGKKEALEKELITCPKCGEKFTLSGKKEAIKDIRIKPDKEESFYREQVELNHLWEKVEEPEPVEEIDEPSVSLKKIEEQLQIIKLLETIPNKDKEKLSQELDQLKSIDDLFLVKCQAYELAESSYEDDVKAWKENLEKSCSYQNEYDQLCKLGNVEEMYSNYEDMKLKLNLYKEALKTYTESLIKYNEVKKVLDDYLTLADKYKKASENLKNMKVKIKQYVLPSLAKVSSALLNEMSEGLYSSIEIDDDFNITINGLDIIGYSGSEQAMANLAIRIGLGEVLTYKSFNVFIGDEIDDSMRPERAQNTADCLFKLSNFIKQIILISHRDIVAHEYITLN